MRKFFIYLIGLFLLVISTFPVIAQSDYINFQVVMKDADDKLVLNKEVTIRLSLLNNSAIGNILYRELHYVQTNSNGIATILIGSGSSDIGKYSSVEWDKSNVFVKVDMDVNQSGIFSEIGVSQLLSVPYAIYAKTAKTANTIPDQAIYTQGDGIEISNNKISNTKPDKDVKITAGTGINVDGAYPNFIITATNTSGDGNGYVAGDGISILSNIITNTKPDKDITLNAGNGVNIVGTYPNFTIAMNPSSSALNAWDSTDILIKGARIITSTNCDTNLNTVGARMLWIGSKAAFRAGWVSETDDMQNHIYHTIWDCDSIGAYSAAFGNSNLAKGFQSFATGKYNRATADNTFVSGYMNKVVQNNAASFGTMNTVSGANSMSIGVENFVLNQNSFSIGANNLDSAKNGLIAGSNNSLFGENSVTFGYDNYVTAPSSLAMGVNNLISGDGASIAIGVGNKATELLSFAIGYGATASGSQSFAIGTSAFTNGHSGAFVISDSNIDTVRATASNQMTMRFTGGYRLFTDNSTKAAILNPNQNAWATLSDSNQKENFIKSDGNDFLTKISKMRLGSWNYKGQNSAEYRHYGAMAQEVFSAFGHDKLGVIGNDTTINAADMDGIMLIAIQELIRQNAEQLKEIEILRNEINALKSNSISSSEPRTKRTKIGR